MSARALRALGNKIRQLRADKGWNQREFARIAGVDTALLSRLESGVGNPGFTTLWSIAKGLGVSLSELVE